MFCRVLGVSRSGYYDWARRVRGPVSGRAAEDAALLEEIRAIHEKFRFYGSPRVHQELARRSRRVGRHRVARLMRADGIRARRGKVKSRPRSAPPKRRPEVGDLVKRRFVGESANRIWFTDLTMIRTGQGMLRAAVILDSYNREVISWAVADHETPATVMRALKKAIRIRRPAPGCIIHSDRGYQFTSLEWADIAAKNGLRISIGERKKPQDNAMMESWFASLKNEDIYPAGQPATLADARMRLFRYIQLYNTSRIHSALGYRSPLEYTKINQ
jgi:putative transposase